MIFHKPGRAPTLRLYLPFLSWHARFMYDKEKTDNYNEMPWGGGLGVSRYNEEGNWSALFAMMFKTRTTNGSPRWAMAGRRAGIWMMPKISVLGSVPRGHHGAR